MTKQMMTMNCHSSEIKNIIYFLANQAAKRYRNSYNTKEDYIQIGFISFLKAQQKWKNKNGNFLSYAFIIISRDINREAIKSTSIFSATFDIKKIINQISFLKSNNHSDEEIISILNIDNNEFHLLENMMSTNDHDKLNNIGCENSYSLINDLFSLKNLTDDDKINIYKQIYRDKSGMNTNKKWRNFQKTKQKILESGYFE